MRLLNKNTFQIHFFLDEAAPPYIILSHRWSGAETSMHEFAEQRSLSRDQWSPGTTKVLTFCEHVKSRKEDYVWIDTCCIDKSSSAELQEAINSMYKWYQQAELCIVYVHDVDLEGADPTDAKDSVAEKLKKSDWFTRGWTLQELLAPREHVFLDCRWQLLGTRQELSATLHEVTKIKPSYFGNTPEIHSATVAERMSWLSLRKTSRMEDMAYCMLGVFDVNMTMLYGEGSKAFLRLQKEIIQNIDDESIFVWQPLPDEAEDETTIPVLAPKPACFSVCRDITIAKSTYLHRDPYRWTMKGLEFELYGERRMQFQANEILIILNCTVDGKRAAYNIRRPTLASGESGNVYRRIATSELMTLQEFQYSYPPTAEDAFQRQIHKLAFSQMQLGGDRPGGYQISAVMDFESENIRFKVFVQ